MANGCLCSLAGTAACKTCPSNVGSYGQNEPYYPGYSIPFPTTGKKTTITEKFDKDGKLVERKMELDV
jgi:hypothetical protein